MPREPLTRAEIAALIDDFDARCARTETAEQAGRLCREFADYAVDGRATLGAGPQAQEAAMPPREPIYYLIWFVVIIVALVLLFRVVLPLLGV
jgi:hypothetical protein